MTMHEIKTTMQILSGILAGWMAFLIITFEKFNKEGVIVHGIITMAILMAMAITMSFKEEAQNGSNK